MASWRVEFQSATRGFADLVAAVGPDQWELPGLGLWSVRELVGHASRSLSLIATYLGADRPPTLQPLADAVAYYRAVFAGTEADPEAKARLDESIAERGRQAGLALGHDPAGHVARLAREAEELVERTADDAVLVLAPGTMTLAGYLPTRTFELAVHGLDLARATGATVPATMQPSIAASCEIAGRLAAAGPLAAAALMLLTGRPTRSDERVSLI